MTAYLVLLRGINVGGKNKVPMAELRKLLEGLGFESVSTYIASGNVFLDSDLSASKVAEAIEAALPKAFKLDADHIKVAVLTADDLEAVVKNRPQGFGDEPSRRDLLAAPQRRTHQEPPRPDRGNAALQVHDQPQLADHPRAAGADAEAIAGRAPCVCAGPRRREKPRLEDTGASRLGVCRLGLGGREDQLQPLVEPQLRHL
jgi:hypothetical protein